MAGDPRTLVLAVRSFEHRGFLRESQQHLVYPKPIISSSSGSCVVRVGYEITAPHIIRSGKNRWHLAAFMRRLFAQRDRSAKLLSAICMRSQPNVGTVFAAIPHWLQTAMAVVTLRESALLGRLGIRIRRSRSRGGWVL